MMRPCCYSSYGADSATCSGAFLGGGVRELPMAMLDSFTLPKVGKKPPGGLMMLPELDDSNPVIC